MKGFLNVDTRLEKEMNEVFQNDSKGISKLEKGLRKFLRIHPWVSKKQGRRKIATLLLQGIGVAIVIISMLVVLNIL